MQTKICLYFINLILSSRNSWIWFTTQVLSAFFNTYQIDRCFSCNLHFRSHQCHVRQCFIYKLVTSIKFAFWSFQNSKCKYSPMPSEFQFKEPPMHALGIPFQKKPLALGIPKSRRSWCMGIFWNCPIVEELAMSLFYYSLIGVPLGSL